MQPLVTFPELFDLTETQPGVFSAGNADNPWGRVFGGQVAAQALFAAGQTVDPALRPHSLHTSFIRAGKFDEPICYTVERVRDGRSFVTRRVAAHQSFGELLSATVSFQRPESGPDITLVEPPDVASPDELEIEDWSPVFHRRSIDVGTSKCLWLRLCDTLDTDDALLHAAGLAFISDDAPMDAGEAVHPLGPVDYGDPDAVHLYHGATLDHSVWFHRPVRADEWTLHRVGITSMASGRAHAVGEIYSADGVHVASLAQEMLLREARG